MIIVIAYLINPYIKKASVKEDTLYVRYLDVGQGDSILLELNEKYMLIDGGTRKSGEDVIYYLEKFNVDKLDILVATHPHEDHIGGLPLVMERYPVNKVYIGEGETDTEIYEEFLVLASKCNTEIISAGHRFKFGDAHITTIAPNSPKYKEPNNYSLCLRLEYGSTSYLFMGDAEKMSEKEILQAGFNVNADCIKVGHHGSASSSSDEFLRAVSPDISVISAGINSYNLPNSDTVEKLSLISEVYRTDFDGLITVSSDGAELEVSCDNSR